MIKKVVAIGDSITWGFPFGENYSWVQELQKKFSEITFINQGINGDTFEGILYRLNNSVLSYNPDLTVITAGLNDIFIGYPLSEIKEFILKIIHQLKANSIKIILGIPINIPLDEYFNKMVEPLHHLIIQIAHDENLPTLDFRVLSLGDFSDDVHPNIQGYKKLGRQAQVFFQDYISHFLKNE